MKIRSAILTQMSGKLGGAVGSTVRGGQAILRTLVIPKNPQSANQAFIRAALSGLASNWKALTDAQRAAWTALASDSESGIDVYVSNNTQLLRAGVARQDTAPATRGLAWLTIPDAATITLGYVSATHVLTVASTVNTTTWLAVGLKLNLYVSTTPQKPSALAEQGNKSFMSTVTTAASNMAATVDADLNPTFSRLSGLGTAPASGSWTLYVRIVGCKSTGEVTSPVDARITVTVT